MTVNEPDNKELVNKSEARPNDAVGQVAMREEETLKFWQDNKIFEKSLEQTAGKPEFVFYEGPPTANAAPALHHLEARAFKDIIPRYKTMQGYHVRRKGGWDTHGLPVELQVEKKLGLKSKKEIESYGIAKFNEECRSSVWEHVEEWEKFTNRIGYWVDQENPYVTYHNSYIESLWNIVSKINERKVDGKDLLYKDYKVVPWCPRCGTALSSHELAQGYQDITDLAVYVKFKVKNPEKIGLSGNVYLLAWTTTAWTLPGNVGLAVGEDIKYFIERTNNEYYILAESLAQKTFEKDGVSLVVKPDLPTMLGRELVGLEYEPLYPYLKNLIGEEQGEQMQNAYKVYPADFVTTVDGTGIVHTAVMYGQEDFELGTRVGLPKFHLVNLDGTFVEGTDFLTGKFVRDESTAVDVIKDLAHRGLLFKKEKYKHSYPHCWRCKTALIYYARDSWYIRMSSLRAELQRENAKINWEPSHIRDGRFGEWLKEAKDWAISRERYWGTPLPAWECASCDKREVIGSVEELRSKASKSGNKYYLMRHGHAENNSTDNKNINGIVSGSPGDPYHVTKEGKEGVLAVVPKLKKAKIDLVITSEFVRARETGEIVREALGLDASQVLIDPRLNDVQAGDFQGKKWTEHHAYFETNKDLFYKPSPGGGESFREVKLRMAEFIYGIEAKYQGKNILILSHGYPLFTLERTAQGMSNEEFVKQLGGRPEMRNAEVRNLPFVPLSHNSEYELDLHRPYIDKIKLKCEEAGCGGEMVRTKEVMDVWFDSGAMPFAQDHYPFENKDWVEGAGYPADFISEAIDQTRGWFYTLLAVGVLMGKGAPYKNVICLGHILDAEGKKMSKSIGNVVNPWEMMDKYGVDALRLWMYSVNQPGDSKNFDEKTVDEIVKKLWNPLTNIYALYAMYEQDVERIEPNKSENILDKWILARLTEVVGSVTNNLDSYKLFEPVRDLRAFVQDLSTWYVRRSRDRFKSEDKSEVAQVVSVTEFVLIEVAKLLAPMAPFFAEQMYQDVTKGKQKESVHLESWTQPRGLTPGKGEEAGLLENMRMTRDVVTLALEARQKADIKVRQPLNMLNVKSLMLNGKEEYLRLIKDEVNVKEIVFDDKLESDVLLDTTITPELKLEGEMRDLVREVQDKRKELNLQPSDKILLVLPESLRGLTPQYGEEIKRTTNSTNIEFGEELKVTKI